jgi:hypothetical protein
MYLGGSAASTFTLLGSRDGRQGELQVYGWGDGFSQFSTAGNGLTVR